MLLLVFGGGTLVLSSLLPFVVKPLLMRLGIMDVPSERSSHDRPILRGLGLAVLIAMMLSLVAVFLFALSVAPGADASKYLLAIGVGTIAAGLLGLGEDLWGLSVPVRSALLLIIAGVSSAAMLWIADQSEEAASSRWVLGLNVAALPLWVLVVLCIYGVLFISSYINVANFMDGLNGISGFHGVIAGLTFSLAGGLTGAVWLAVSGLILATGFAGFLPWNLTKPGAFLGDVGSYLLGGAIAILSFAAFVDGLPFLATIGPMVIYFGDVGVTLVKRVRAGHKWDEPHKEHVYQRIQQLGYSHVWASGVAALCTLLTSLLGLASIYADIFGSLALLVGGLTVLIFYLALPRILPAREL
ncbi:UDP-phosphate alpha-N-acetyl-D-fucosaminephosphotransferase [Leucobacter coleopterorum]|uniref:UDP-phosphate alpha-N-acetyl-D-fucosaminephosphotransferase n=2 Tax=Leucobacter coleopterorum TaxID=2714933 RepID=A0ABX6K391_9MICO|nr:UDP-phosphate alpha-N-acetyl-D-fucosaminephosphotransferase [Leucobacter coleopterorum]